jgi:hypothetical protein
LPWSSKSDARKMGLCARRIGATFPTSWGGD